jgi:hypothetical protein
VVIEVRGGNFWAWASEAAMTGDTWGVWETGGDMVFLSSVASVCFPVFFLAHKSSVHSSIVHDFAIFSFIIFYIYSYVYILFEPPP